MEGIFKYTIEMGSDVMIYVPSFVIIGTGEKHRQEVDRISLLSERRLKIKG
jgi:hypothetical protein